MSYCRFENTLSDLRDCSGALTDARDWETLMLEASEYEKAAMLAMGKACEEMAEKFKELGPYNDNDIGPGM